MDSYERLAAINESMISRGIKAVGKAIAAPIRRAVKTRQRKRNIAGFEQQLRDSGVLDKLNSLEDSFNPSVNPNEKIDQEFDNARDALRKAGIPHMGQRAIGSMNRERNKFGVHPKFKREAKQALEDFPKVDLEINDKMPEQPMKRKGKEEVQKETHMDPFQRLEAINETLTRIFAEDVDPDRSVSVGDRLTVEFGRRTSNLPKEDRDKAIRSAQRKTATEKRKAPKGSKAAHNVVADAGRRYRVGTERPADPENPKHAELLKNQAVIAAIQKGMSAD